MQFEYDPENLIEAVKIRPGLWDINHPRQRQKNARLKLWTQIVEELIQGGTVTADERRELVVQLQIKWKSLRDRFQKYILNPNKRKPYIYASHMHFLLKDNKWPTRRSETKDDGSNGSTEEDDDDRPTWKLRKRVKICKKEQVTDEEQDPLPSENDGYGFSFSTVDAVSGNDTYDLDKMFLMSLLPHLKSIPEPNKLSAKTEIMQILQKANQVTDNPQ